MSKITYEYDVALSFAGENRQYVEKLVIYLRKMGIRFFYDKFEEANLWGKNLYDYLMEVYSTKAKYTVIFISRDYSTKLWTNHERQSAQERAFREKKSTYCLQNLMKQKFLEFLRQLDT